MTMYVKELFVRSLVVVLALCGIPCAASAQSVRPLANDYVAVFRSTDPEGIYVYSPGLACCPSGQTVAFLPMPGGQMKFHVLYDEPTRLYWLLSSQATDSMTRSELLPPSRFNLPNNERHRLQLHFSKNLVDWCFAGLVAMTDDPRQARRYASMVIDGDHLHVLSRSGTEHAHDAHNGDVLSFHTVQDFRNLVY